MYLCNEVSKLYDERLLCYHGVVKHFEKHSSREMTEQKNIVYARDLRNPSEPRHLIVPMDRGKNVLI